MLTHAAKWGEALNKRSGKSATVLEMERKTYVYSLHLHIANKLTLVNWTVAEWRRSCVPGQSSSCWFAGTG